MRHHLLSVALLVAQACAQTTWTVPPGTSDLVPYVNQAAPGDTLLVSGFVNGLTLTKGVNLVGPVTIGLNGNPPNPIYNDNRLVINLPPGQEARLVGISMRSSDVGGVLTIEAVLQVQHGAVSLEDVNLADGRIELAGDTKLQRCSARSPATSASVAIVGGTSVMTDCTFTGPNEGIAYGGGPVACGPAVQQSGGLVLASHVLVTGGSRNPRSPFGVVGDPAGWRMTGGVTLVTDSAIRGGDGATNPVLPGSGGNAVVVTGGSFSLARTSLTEGLLAGAPSVGYQTVPEMVGMRANAPPSRGQSFTATATAGSSQQPLCLVGGFDGTLGSVPPVVEPLFGQPSQLVTLELAIPPPGSAVSTTIQVPNLALLRGVTVWIQALQLSGAEVRASTVVGGTVR